MRRIAMVCVAVWLFVSMVSVCGCLTPPEKTVFIDLDNDGKVDALAWDRDGDGLADTNEQGEPALVPGSSIYRAAELADLTMPEVLAGLGGVLGVPVLIGLGAAWKGSRLGRVIANTVMSVQIARQRLKDKGSVEALALLDETLRSAQLEQTVKAVQAAKEKLGLPSVTDPAGAEGA